MAQQVDNLRGDVTRNMLGVSGLLPPPPPPPGIELRSLLELAIDTIADNLYLLKNNNILSADIMRLIYQRSIEKRTLNNVNFQFFATRTVLDGRFSLTNYSSLRPATLNPFLQPNNLAPIFQGIVELDLSGTVLLDSDLLPMFCRALNTSLRSLNINKTDASDRVVMHVTHCTNLEVLEMRSVNLSSETACAIVRACTKLQSLNLKSCYLNSKVLSTIATTLRQLTRFEVHNHVDYPVMKYLSPKHMGPPPIKVLSYSPSNSGDIPGPEFTTLEQLSLEVSDMDGYWELVDKLCCLDISDFVSGAPWWAHATQLTTLKVQSMDLKSLPTNLATQIKCLRIEYQPLTTAFCQALVNFKNLVQLKLKAVAPFHIIAPTYNVTEISNALRMLPHLQVLELQPMALRLLANLQDIAPNLTRLYAIMKYSDAYAASCYPQGIHVALPQLEVLHFICPQLSDLIHFHLPKLKKANIECNGKHPLSQWIGASSLLINITVNIATERDMKDMAKNNPLLEHFSYVAPDTEDVPMLRASHLTSLNHLAKIYIDDPNVSELRFVDCLPLLGSLHIIARKLCKLELKLKSLFDFFCDSPQLTELRLNAKNLTSLHLHTANLCATKTFLFIPRLRQLTLVFNPGVEVPQHLKTKKGYNEAEARMAIIAELWATFSKALPSSLESMILQHLCIKSVALNFPSLKKLEFYSQFEYSEIKFNCPNLIFLEVEVSNNKRFDGEIPKVEDLFISVQSSRFGRYYPARVRLTWHLLNQYSADVKPILQVLKNVQVMEANIQMNEFLNAVELLLHCPPTLKQFVFRNVQLTQEMYQSFDEVVARLIDAGWNAPTRTNGEVIYPSVDLRPTILPLCLFTRE